MHSVQVQRGDLIDLPATARNLELIKTLRGGRATRSVLDTCMTGGGPCGCWNGATGWRPAARPPRPCAVRGAGGTGLGLCEQQA